MMSLVLPDGYVLDLLGPFYGKDNDNIHFEGNTVTLLGLCGRITISHSQKRMFHKMR